MIHNRHIFMSVPVALAAIMAGSMAQAGPTFAWSTVVNNTVAFPGDGRPFNSYNQPSVNNEGLVVFRARTAGGGGLGQPGSGIFTRDMSGPGNPLNLITARGLEVPQPNNTGATFNEFPSIPRIDARSSMVATRGQSQPVLEYQVGIDPGTGEAITTKGGTSGIYTNPNGPLVTGMSGLGNVNGSVFPANPDLSHFQVPGTTPGTKFDQFPGAPSPTGDFVVFKGNWTDTSGGGSVGRTGVYYRNVNAAGGLSPTQLVADSTMEIPGVPGTNFGSTAPPSAAKGRMVFLGVDNEEVPTAGGIFMSMLDDLKAPDAPGMLKTIVTIGQAVVGKSDAYFSRIGEALSFSGSKVGFWGAWGQKDTDGNVVTQMRTINISCASIERETASNFCNAQDDGTTPGSGIAGDGIYTFEVPIDQGFFVTDVNSLETRLIAETGGGFLDFVYWNFSGKIPGEEGEEDGEFARWRSASFLAADGWNAVFRGDKDDGASGLYGVFGGHLSTVAEIGMDGGLLDPDAAGLPIVSLGIERDGFRNGWLTINSSMTDGESSMAGVYVAQVPEPGTWVMLIAGFGLAGAALRRRRQEVLA
jgi:hypothetical protein